MSELLPPGDSVTTSTPLPRYRGFRGALHVGLVTMLSVVLIGGMAALTLWFLIGTSEVALQVFVRFAWFGAAAGASALLLRTLCNAQSDRLLTLRSAKGERAGAIGFLAGILLAGYLAEPGALAPDANDQQPAIGQAIDLSGPTLDGGHFDLAGYRGKVVLVDFWATWCGPCIGELPNVRAAYERYHGDGFEVAAVSLDNDRLALARFLEPNPEPWPQVFFDKDGQRGFDNPLAKRFHIQAIPYLLVIDRDGKLIARNVRGRQIEAAVAAALGLPIPWSDRLAGAGWRLLGWFFTGVIGAPLWMMCACILSGTIAFTIIELGARRVLRSS